jgi:hypothetical protein
LHPGVPAKTAIVNPGPSANASQVTIPATTTKKTKEKKAAAANKNQVALDDKPSISQEPQDL